jgi:hypothetical protein
MSISFEDLGFRHIGRTKIPNNWRGIYRRAGYDFRPKDLLRHSLRTGEGSCFPTIALIRKDETAKGVAAVSRSLVENRIRADALGVKNVFSSTSVLEDLIRETAKSDTSDPRFLHMCNNALALATRPDDLTYLMNQVILPAFFSRFPAGQMQCLSSSNVIEEIRTIVTLQYSAEHHNICQADDIAGSMRKWHSADSEQLLRGILGMAGFLWPRTLPATLLERINRRLLSNSIRLLKKNSHHSAMFGVTISDMEASLRLKTFRYLMLSRLLKVQPTKNLVTAND